MDWKRLPAYVIGSVDEELLVRHEYPVSENRILRQQITQGRCTSVMGSSIVPLADRLFSCRQRPCAARARVLATIHITG
jgi:hypothetical protein